MAAPVTAYVGLGSNLDGPAARITRAFDELACLPETRLTVRSPLYMSPPMGPADQPDYVNAVVALATGLAPLALLQELLAIEAAAGASSRRQRIGVRAPWISISSYMVISLLETPDCGCLIPACTSVPSSCILSRT